MMRMALAFLVTACLAASAAPADEPSVTRITFPNGLRLLVRPEPGRGLVALTVVVRAGALEEMETPGVGQVLARVLLTGARNLSERKLARLVDEVGGSFSVTWDPDYTEIYVSTTSAQLRAAMELLAETLIEPRLDAARIAEARQQVADDAREAARNPFRAGYDRLVSMLHPGRPYGRPLLADPARLEQITPEQVQRFLEDWFVPSNMVLAVVGDVSVEQVRDAARLWFGRLKPSATPERRPPSAPPPPSSGPAILEMESGVTYVLAGAPASGLRSREYATDCIVAAVLGGGKASRMFQQIREEQGLVYELGTLYPPLLYHSHVVAYALSPAYLPAGFRDADPSFEQVRAALKASVDSLVQSPITEAELTRARNYLTGTYALRHQRLQERSKHLAWFEAMGLGWEFDRLFPEMLQSVTLEDVRRRARELFERSAVVVVVPRE